VYNKESNIFDNCTFDSNPRNIYFFTTATGIKVINSKIIGATIYGVDFSIAADDSVLFYNNFFNNTGNDINFGTSYSNEWNTTKQSGIRIYSNGTQIGGNFWANASAEGFSETCADIDQDGFCDTNYTIDSNNVDYLPLSLNFSNTVPTITSIKSIITNLGDTQDIKLNVTANDLDGLADLDSSWVGSVFALFVNAVAVLDITNNLIFNGEVFINDSSDAQDSEIINFTVINNSITESSFYSHTLNTQGIEKNDTFWNRGSGSLDYYITHYTPTGGTLDVGGTLTGTALSQTNTTIYSNWTGDWITSETEDTYLLRENASYSHNLTSQRIFNTTNLSVSNSQSFTFNNVDITSYCDITTTANIPSGTNEITQSCSNESYIGDWLDEIFGSWVQDTISGTTEANSSAYITRYLNVTANAGVNFTNVNVSANMTNRTGWSCPDKLSLINISDGANQFNYAINCTKENVTTFVQGALSTDATEVIVQTAYHATNLTTYYQLNVSNNDTAVNFTTWVNSTPNSKWIDFNTTAYTPDVFVAKNSTNTSVTVNFSKSTIVEDSYVDAYQTIGATSVKNTYIAYLTVNENITTKTLPIRYHIPKSRGFGNWDDRTSETGYVNDSSTNITIEETITGYIDFVIGTEHSNSSLEEGSYTLNLIYYTPKTPETGGTGGGGGGGAAPVRVDFDITPKEFSIKSIPSKKKQIKLNVINLEEDKSILIKFELAKGDEKYWVKQEKLWTIDPKQSKVTCVDEDFNCLEVIMPEIANLTKKLVIKVTAQKGTETTSKDIPITLNTVECLNIGEKCDQNEECCSFVCSRDKGEEFDSCKPAEFAPPPEVKPTEIPPWQTYATIAVILILFVGAMMMRQPS
jgi:hypothetical protein